MKLAILKILSIMLVAAVVVSACKPGPVTGEPEKVAVNGGYYWDISSAQLNDMLKSKDFIMVNTHTPYYAELAETDLFIPAANVEESISMFPQNKGDKIVVYCQAGTHSAIAARKLVELGYTNVWNLKVGMVEWEDEGYELIRNPQ